MEYIDIKTLNLNNKRVLIRSDLNVPIKDSKIISTARIKAAISTILHCLKNNAKVLVMSHLGRPKEGEYDKKLSLFPIFQYLKKKITFTKVHFVKNYLNNEIQLINGELYILENVRFNIGENNNDINLSKKYAKLCDIFVMDAFGSIHRTQSSTVGIAQYASISCAGLLLTSEITSLDKILKNPKKPMISIIGGSKVSTKFNMLNHLLHISDIVIVGGGIANTFLAINNHIGKSLHEKEFVKEASLLYKNFNIVIPIDSRVSKEFHEYALPTVKLVSNIQKDEEIMDIGPKSENIVRNIIKSAKTILWNGPVGVFEFKNFSHGTKTLAHAIANCNAFSIAGGGDTISAIDIFKVRKKISYISTGGGSFLKYLEGKVLPGMKFLNKKDTISN
ncbi:phosphoglycerate kinase [Buchnera aphidicola]|uniref:Phosphoglycerate kinase n=1 Tax=Buchnera aphidicola (Anoecia oenotherae) TaxID=1241833 RepID=A0A4D6Y4W7_9GAMM|nr:phosphoglycerate kinase [Buchnera aphidicola]QCI19465.1 phosphoglycerate kinase [Buchnera aphidicola (Anoecia oenotherae)]